MPTKGTLTRQHIIASAAPVFNVKGFAGASMSDILAATGLQKGGLYRHFASKDALALAAFKYAFRILEQRHEAAVAGHTTAIGRLSAAIDVVASSIRQPPLRGGCPILNTAIEADDTHPALRKQTAPALRRWQDRIVRIVAGGIESGELRAGVVAEDVASVVTSALEGSIMVSSLLREPAHMDASAAHLRAWLETLRADGKSRGS